MKANRVNTLARLAGTTGIVLGLTLFGGCATGNRETQTQHDDRTVRGLTDSLTSPANNYPSNVPK